MSKKWLSSSRSDDLSIIVVQINDLTKQTEIQQNASTNVLNNILVRKSGFIYFLKPTFYYIRRLKFCNDLLHEIVSERLHYHSKFVHYHILVNVKC